MIWAQSCQFYKKSGGNNNETCTWSTGWYTPKGNQAAIRVYPVHDALRTGNQLYLVLDAA